MDFKRVYTSSKTYIILLVVGLALLLFMASMSYRQIMRMQQAADMVAHTLKVYNILSDLSAHYTQADSEVFREKLVDKDSFETVLRAYKSEGANIIESLRVSTQESVSQQSRINSLKVLLNTLYDQLYLLPASGFEGNTEDALQYRHAQAGKINATLYQIRSINKSMLSEEEYLMELRQAKYLSHKHLAPATSLVLAFFALFITFVSFLRIYRNKLRIRQSEGFLKSVLATTDNIVNYYEPIYDAEGSIIDFKIVFANACNRDYLGLDPDEVMDKPLSEVHALYKMNGELDALIACCQDQTKTNFSQQVDVNDEAMWFHVFVTPLATGALVTSRNTTADEKSKKEQFALKQRLEDQNLKLLDNRALLSNIFKSISHVVMHFLSIRDENGEIVDFEILFVNDRIYPITGDNPDDLKNKLVSKAFPTISETVIFNHLVNAIERNKAVEYLVPYTKNGREHWFQCTAIKLGDGVTVTSREVTEEKQKEAQLLSLNDELAVQNSILSDAERIAKIGCFLWYIEKGKVEISDNFYSILGYDVKEFNMTLEKYREFIHYEDLSLYDDRLKEIMETNVHEEHMYRIITKTGEIKHLRTNSQDVIKNGERIMVGVVQDVTENIETEEILRVKNRELLRSNAELESFNRVSSHDLQEPLRKIRLFISRIQDKEGDNFSSTGTEYFNKVKNSVERMQALIDNLLSYSQIDSSQEDFEQLDLNEVLEKVEEDLTARINEVDAKINSDKLPVIEGLVFQMEQLFTNLISNAIKYRDAAETPIIHITYEKIEATKIVEPFIKTHKYYHKLSFIDNGIGFDPEYAEKIFEVFQRLHQKNEYSGTGIGLAICKKIIENHNGYIYAVGRESKGATFVVYLPD